MSSSEESALDQKLEHIELLLEQFSFVKLCRCCRSPCECRDCETCRAPLKKTGRILDEPGLYEHPEPTR